MELGSSTGKCMFAQQQRQAQHRHKQYLGSSQHLPTRMHLIHRGLYMETSRTFLSLWL